MCARLKNSYLFESLGVFFARAYQMSLTELTSALTKMAKKEKGAKKKAQGERGKEKGESVVCLSPTKSKCTTLVHFATQPFRSVILSAAKNPSTTLRTGLTARPFAEFILSEVEGLRVTDLLCQFFVARFRAPAVSYMP